MCPPQVCPALVWLAPAAATGRKRLCLLSFSLFGAASSARSARARGQGDPAPVPRCPLDSPPPFPRRGFGPGPRGRNTLINHCRGGAMPRPPRCAARMPLRSRREQACLFRPVRVNTVGFANPTPHPVGADPRVRPHDTCFCYSIRRKIIALFYRERACPFPFFVIFNRK